jgi:hypothetical protein
MWGQGHVSVTQRHLTLRQGIRIQNTHYTTMKVASIKMKHVYNSINPIMALIKVYFYQTWQSL